MVAATFPTLLVRERPDRQPEVRAARKSKARWQNANHGVGTPVECDGLIYGAGVASKPVRPQRVAQNHHGRRAGLVFIIVEQAADGRLSSQCGEAVSRYAHTGQTMRLALAGEVVTSPVVNADVFEDRLLRPPIAEVRVGDRHGGEVRAAFAQPDEPLGFRVGQRTEQHGIHDAEDRRVRSDAQCDREHGHRGEAGIVQQLAEGEFEIIHGSLNR